MRRSSIVLFSAAAVLLGSVWFGHGPTLQAQGQQAAAQLTVEKIKDNLWVIIGDGGNVALYATSEGTILVDDKYERDYTDIMAKVKSVTNQPVKYVLNTHQHGDHTGSNAQLLGANAEIIAHRNARANMVAGKMPGVPRIAFSDETSVFLGGKEVRARYFGRGHTNGDAIIYFPDAKVIHTGDLVTASPPLVDYSGKGSAAEWAGTLDNLLKAGWNYDTVIPGHGPIFKPGDVVKYRDNVTKIKDRVAALVRAGKGKDDVTKVLVNELGFAPDGFQIRSVAGWMDELRK